MSTFILNFTRGGTKDKKAMPAQARQLLEAGLWGVPPNAQLRQKIAPGDRVLAYVGAPDRVFIGDAKVQRGYHAWTSDEAAKYPMTSTFGHGLTLAHARVWPKPVPIMSVWPKTRSAKTNPKALWYGAIASVSAADAELLLAAAGDIGQGSAASTEAQRSHRSRPLGHPRIPLDDRSRPRPRTRHRRSRRRCSWLVSG